MEEKIRKTMSLYLIFFLVLVSPIFLIPIEKVLPYPFVVEELAKILMIVKIYDYEKENLYLGAVFGGFLLAFSESVLFWGGALFEGEASFFLVKSAITLIVHLLTMVVYAWAIKKGKVYLAMSLTAGIVFHYLVNHFSG